MSLEQEAYEPTAVEALYYYPKARSLVIQVEGGLAFALIHQPDGLFYELLRPGGTATQQSVERLIEDQEAAEALAAHASEPAETATGSTREKSPTIVLPGKLQSKPTEGRPDRHQKPTAWARFLARVEGREGATLLSTSFHGRTRELALGLNAGDAITAQGYLHLRPLEDERLSTFSVIHLVHYPGKPTPEWTVPRRSGPKSGGSPVV